VISVHEFDVVADKQRGNSPWPGPTARQRPRKDKEVRRGAITAPPVRPWSPLAARRTGAPHPGRPQRATGADHRAGPPVHNPSRSPPPV